MNRDTRSPRRIISRWSLFLLLVFMAVITLVGIIRSGSVGESINFRTFSKSSGGGQTYWSLISTYGHLAFRTRTIPAYKVTASSEPFFLYLSGEDDPRISKKPSFSYLWILGIECLGLFFLVPSIVTKTDHVRD